MLTEYLVGVLLGLPSLGLAILSQVELWQRKEYRWDRLRSYLRSPEARQYARSWLVPAILLTDAGWLAYLTGHYAWARWLGMAAVLCLAAYHVHRIHQRGIFRPVFTTKARFILLILGLLGLVCIWRVIVLQEQFVLQVATLIMLLPFLVAAVVGLVNLATTTRKRQIIESATRLRQKMKDLRVIGVTGSYGKTSTKHFLQQLLPDSVATSEHVNSEIGVAQDMLQKIPSLILLLGKGERKYVVEMGAYRQGEIAALARMTRPTIGVITAIGNQHLDLFGSQQSILLAKWELIEGLEPYGVAVLNADDPLLVEKARGYKGKIVWFNKEVKITEVAIDARNLTGVLHIGSASQAIQIPLASQGLLQSVLAAVAAAWAVGEEPAEIFKRVQSLQPFPRTMEVIQGVGGATIIDDSYSANEVGVVNAIEHLQLFSEQDKRIVMVPLIELGEAAAAAHQRIGQALASSGAKVFVYGESYKTELGQPFFTDAKELAQVIRPGLGEKSVVLLEGRIPDIVRQALL